MSITIELTDDQALSIMAQVGNLLKKDSPSMPAELAARATAGEKLRAHLAKNISPEGMFSSQIVRGILQLSDTAMQSALKTLAATGEIKMLRKGTWQRLR